MEERASIVTQSIGKLRAGDRGWALSRKGLERLSDDKPADILNLPEDDGGLYYKDMLYTPHKLYQRLIITYSPRYARHQKTIRDRQIERTREVIDSGSIKKKRKRPNDPTRFIGEMAATGEDGMARIHYHLDTNKISGEAPHDGFYVVAIDLLNGNVMGILKVSEGRRYRSRALCLLLVLSWVWSQPPIPIPFCFIECSDLTCKRVV